jgi:hypothetical protein
LHFRTNQKPLYMRSTTGNEGGDGDGDGSSQAQRSSEQPEKK